VNLICLKRLTGVEGVKLSSDMSLVTPVRPAAPMVPCALMFALVLVFGLDGRAAPVASIQDPTAKIVETLHARGAKLERARNVVWFDPDELARADGDRLADAIASGITDVEKMLGVSFDSTEKLEFFVTAEFGQTSMTTRTPRRVFLSLERVRERRAPYIHETVHCLAFQRAAAFREDIAREELPLWIIEGFPNYVQAALAEKSDYLLEHPMIPGNARVDDEARRVLASPIGPELVEFVGRGGSPQRLDDRERVARPFYALSQSFTKRLMEVVGIRSFAVKLMPLLWDRQAFAKAVQESTGTPLEQIRRDWLTRLGG
jgi:hypothetical protein